MQLPAMRLSRFMIATALVFGAITPAFANETLPADGLPGGATTWQKKTGRMAFTHHSANMTFEKRLDFKLGEALFQRLWVTAPTRTKAADGLGPLFNSRACNGCHIRNGRGHPVDANDPSAGATSMLLRLSIPPQNDTDRELLAAGRVSTLPDPVYGGQFQDFSIPSVPAEGKVTVRYDTQTIELSDGTMVELRHPTYGMADLAYGPLHDDVMISPRIAPPMIGLGLLEAIPDEVLLANADPQDRDGNGISGRVNRVWDIAKDELAIGRFGWKAGMPTLDQQNQNAFQFDIGLSTPLYPNAYSDCTEAQSLCRGAPDGNDPEFDNLEAHDQITDLVLYYARNIAPPMRQNASDPDVMAGREIFNSIGCASCHTPSYQLPERADMPEQSGQVIWPHSDLLLHDMGDGLADHRPEAEASGTEWRTPPLWGLGRAQEIDPRAGYLHDGRARSILEAVLWHGGEAKPARDAVTFLPSSDRSKLLAFLKSL
ncbi:thiol oxidoreductase [Thalassospira lucentensis]|uniref:Thiol oxidoreductase n=1 Tax=Thalassospira lucentensis TaxID=168935 RepID=A0A154L2E3_9PROT|nr:MULTISPECIES: di-heme oxidoredictase family protein [Thalassospira]KZB62001.1 thiol oxidoreductase [Thalassospira lucentensis]MCH2276278.1 thiol oxidoreductase [Thalassospira sp.]